MPPRIPVPKGLVVVREYRKEPQQAPVKVRVAVAKKKKASARGRSARRKGHSFEREIAIKFRAAGYTKARRQLEYQEGLGIDIAEVGIYDPQCKRSSKFVSVSKIKEVPVKEGRVPLLISKTDLEATYVTLPLDHFLELIKRN